MENERLDWNALYSQGLSALRDAIDAARTREVNVSMERRLAEMQAQRLDEVHRRLLDAQTARIEALLAENLALRRLIDNSPAMN